ncbi:MAG: hypothetical protein RMJ04_11560 [Geminicoccaceae bacterium]|nr:hypothetical protein [Geminicoccaceae bacterium]
MGASSRTRAARGRPRDHQRSRVYRFEEERIFPGRDALMDLDACRALVDAVFRWAEAGRVHEPDWAPPRVTDGRGRRHACGSRAVVKLPRWARTAPVVLHECAHGLAGDGHGPRFVAAYVALLERFLGMDGAGLRAALARAGIACGEARWSPERGLRLKSLPAQSGVSPRKRKNGSTRPSRPKTKTS